MQVSLAQPAGYGYIHPTTKVTTAAVTHDGCVDICVLLDTPPPVAPAR